jgi:glycosyltransferase involved in cell wall biosynthesis
MTRLPLISVIIPCYNQGHFLAEAIESGLNQSYRRLEIIVVDDGSTDESAQVAIRYKDVRLIRQPNSGLSAARNAGLAASAGDYLVFVDADDRLLPDALQAGAQCLASHPEYAFVYGHYKLITADGHPLPATERRQAREGHYLEMLRANYIGMHATVMYRRVVFETVGGFDTTLDACEDYDLYLRITKRLPIYCHARVVAEYRQHNSNMSLDAGLMLKTSLHVLGSQRRHVKGNVQAQRAYREGIRYWQAYYGRKLIKNVRAQAQARDWKKALSGAFTLVRYYPGGVASKLSKRLISTVVRRPRRFSIRLSR